MVVETSESMTGHHWAIILAGGEGERMRPFVERWLGYHRPKQYCTFFGDRSLLGRAVQRATALVNPDYMLTVIGRNHRNYLTEADDSALPGQIVAEPQVRDSGPAIFLAAAHVLSRDPLATLLILPSDHFVFPEDRFVRHVKRAGLLAEQFPHRLVVLGALPYRAEEDYGWIEPGAGCCGRGRPDLRPGLEDVEWSDWGRPERIVESLARIGEKPSFPVEYLEEQCAGSRFS